MDGYPRDALVSIPRFEYRRDGDDVILSVLDGRVLLCIPAEGLDILQSLASGRTVGETVDRYERTHGETPDIADFVNALNDQGFLVTPDDDDVGAPDGGPGTARAEGPGGDLTPGDLAGCAHGHRTGHDPGHPQGHEREGGRRLPRRSLNFDWISPTVARRLCGIPTLVVSALFVTLGVTLIVDDPHLLPTTSALLFPKGHFSALTLATIALALGAVMLHETAHAVVARSLGASARLGLGNLMYVMVAQTDITAIWMAPRRKRYLAFLSGTIVDLVTASFLVDVLWAQRHGRISLDDTVAVPLLSAFLFTYFGRIAFQFLFYLRTDIYYVLATALRCKNLMSDTEDFLRDRIARLLGRRTRVDQSGIPEREMKRIRGYAVLYVVGRIFWFVIFVLFYIPLFWKYTDQFVLLFTGRPHRFETVDFVTVGVVAFLVDGGGTVMWLRGLYREQRRRRAAAEPSEAPSATAPV